MILWISTYPFAGRPYWGTFHRTQARALVAAGVDLRVVSPVPWVPPVVRSLKPRWRELAAAPRVEHDGPLVVERPRYPAVRGLPAWSHGEAIMALAVERSMATIPRLVHAHYAMPFGAVAARLARRWRTRYVVTLHGSDISVWPERHPRRIGELRRVLQGAAHVIAVSRAVADRAADVAGVNAEVIPVGIDLQGFRRNMVERALVRRDLGLPLDDFVVLFVGNLVPEKGVRELVAAVARLGDPYRVVLLGDGLLRFHRQDELRDRVRYPGAVPNEAVARYMSAADLLVLPSRHEGLGLVLAEAGVASLPAVGTDVGGIPELLGGDRGLLIPTADPEVIARAISSVRADPAAARDRAARLREHVKQRYDATVNAVRVRQIYEEILSSDRATGLPC